MLESIHDNERMRRLKYEKNAILSRISSTMQSFDAAVGELREEQYKLMNDLKLTDLRFLTLLKELFLLSSFEEREIFLNGALLKNRTCKAQIVVDLTECQERLAAKLEEINEWKQKDERIQTEFDQIVGQRNPFYEDLKKIFFRRIKRNKHRKESNENDQNDEEDEEENESTQSDFHDSMSEISNEEKSENDDSCPKDCDNLIYEKVMELREKRFDQKEILNEFEAAVNELRASNLLLIGKERQIDEKLAETEAQIASFQTEKQHFLNEIVVTVPLRLSQIRIVEKLADCNEIKDKLLIFETKSLSNLQGRIEQQKKEKVQTKKDYFELRKLHKSQRKKICFQQSEIESERRKCEQVQFLKYGRLVALEVLDANNDVSKETVLLSDKLGKLQKECKQKLSGIEFKLAQSKKELQSKIILNTQNIQKLTALKCKESDLRSELSQILDCDVIADSAPSDQKRNRELQKLVQVAKTQANEIDVLKAEIHLLQRKGGMLYAVPEI